MGPTLVSLLLPWGQPGIVTCRRRTRSDRGRVFVLPQDCVRLARVRGSHHIFVHPAVAELVNLQEVSGQCKPYQVRQVLRLVDRYNLKLEAEP